MTSFQSGQVGILTRWSRGQDVVRYGLVGGIAGCSAGESGEMMVGRSQKQKASRCLSTHLLLSRKVCSGSPPRAAGWPHCSVHPFLAATRR